MYCNESLLIWIGHTFGLVYSPLMDSEKIGYIENTDIINKFTL